MYFWRFLLSIFSSHFNKIHFSNCLRLDITLNPSPTLTYPSIVILIIIISRIAIILWSEYETNNDTKPPTEHHAPFDDGVDDDGILFPSHTIPDTLALNCSEFIIPHRSPGRRSRRMGIYSECKCTTDGMMTLMPSSVCWICMFIADTLFAPTFVTPTPTHKLIRDTSVRLVLLSTSPCFVYLARQGSSSSLFFTILLLSSLFLVHTK